MKKSTLFVAILSLSLLAGCNWNDNKDNAATPVRDVENGVNDVMDDTRDAVDDTIDAVDPNAPRNGNGQINEGTINNDLNRPNGTSGPNVDNGVTAPGAPSVNTEDIIEDKKDRNDKDNVDNH
ncbi:MAG: hypothetical protein ABS944_12260 [Solibacillus sp.]|uniref:hypothetical protein n=1 Tax=unclassified Solibacillus TaxID=2637870 RepID=UPI0030F5B57C